MKRKTKNFLKILFIFILIFLISAQMNDIAYFEKRQDRKEIKKIYTIIPKQKSFIGYVASQNSISLSFKTEGNITFCPYTEGDWVKKGMLLARNDGNLDSFEMKKELEKLEELKIKSAKADKYYERMNTLHKSGAISDNDWEEAFYSAKTAKKETSVQNEIVKKAKEKAEFTKIYAPFDGYILKRVLDKNEFAPIGATVLILNNSNNTQIETMLDFSQQAKIKVNSKTKITKEHKEYFGLVKQISSSSLNKGGYLVKILLNNSYPELKEGENVTVDFLELKTKKVFIPLKFVKKEKNENFIYKLNKNKVEKLRINTGKIQEFNDEFYIEALDKLKIGDEIIEFEK